MMDQYKDIFIAHTKLPTYLEELLQKKEEIILVQRKRKIVELNCTNEEGVTENTMVELTGNPLEIDLDVWPDSHNISSNFTPDEVSHIPLKLRIARKFINSYKEGMMEGAPKTTSIYCLCDGSDPKRIVVLGTGKSNGYVFRLLVSLRNCVSLDYPERNIDSMIDEHIQNVGVNKLRVDPKVTCVHELYGYKLNNISNIDEIETTGSVLIEQIWNSHEFSLPEHGATIKMMLQVIVGHKNSVVYSIFEELTFLYHCINILTNITSKANTKQEQLDECIISFNPMEINDINKNISELLQIINTLKKPFTAPTNIWEAIANLENKNMIDKLWSILKSCRNVEDLRLCLSYLFESISEIPKSAVAFDENSVTIIGKMLNDIYTERLMVPCLSSKQSLELLIDLGLQKLKRNYFSILQYCGFNIGEQLSNMWNDLSSLTEPRRTTLVELNLSNSLSQLNLLLSLQVVLEFLQLVEEKCSFCKDVSLAVMKQAYNVYVADSTDNNLLLMLEKKQVCDLVVPLSYTDINLFAARLSKWQLKLVSNLKNSSVATVFHYSRKSLFPETMCKYNELNESIEDAIKEKFFVTHLSYFSDKVSYG